MCVYVSVCVAVAVAVCVCIILVFVVNFPQQAHKVQHTLVRLESNLST